MRAGGREENRQGSIRHAHAAILHGRDDAMALTLGGFCIGLVEHDRAAAREAFDAAVALSPSSALTYSMGSIVRAWAGEAERAVEWAEQALRLSPFDPFAFGAWHAIAISRFRQGRYEDAANAARKAVQRNPGFSALHVILAAALVRLGHLDEAKATALRVLGLQPGFSIAEFFAVIDSAPEIATPMTEALRAAGLPP
jgi:tetratricopeptide (TPR) repeat protein